MTPGLFYNLKKPLQLIVAIGDGRSITQSKTKNDATRNTGMLRGHKHWRNCQQHPSSVWRLGSLTVILFMLIVRFDLLKILKKAVCRKYCLCPVFLLVFLYHSCFCLVLADLSAFSRQSERKLFSKECLFTPVCSVDGTVWLMWLNNLCMGNSGTG